MNAVGVGDLRIGFLEESAFVASIFDSRPASQIDDEERQLMVSPFYDKFNELKSIVLPLIEIDAD